MEDIFDADGQQNFQQPVAQMQFSTQTVSMDAEILFAGGLSGEIEDNVDDGDDADSMFSHSILVVFWCLSFRCFNCGFV